MSLMERKAQIRVFGLSHHSVLLSRCSESSCVTRLSTAAGLGLLAAGEAETLDRLLSPTGQGSCNLQQPWFLICLFIVEKSKHIHS